MKPFLGMDLTTDKKNKQFNGTEFLIQKPSAGLANTLDVSSKKVNTTLEKSKLPKALRIVQYCCGFIGLLMAASILKANVSFAEGYQNAPWAFWIAGICLQFGLFYGSGANVNPKLSWKPKKAHGRFLI